MLLGDGFDPEPDVKRLVCVPQVVRADRQYLPINTAVVKFQCIIP